MIGIIDRYLLKESFKLLAAILITLSLVLSALGFVRLLERVALGDLNPEVVFPLMGYEVLFFLGRSIPAAYFLSVLAVLGRMYRDSEVTALAACGVGTGRLYRAFAFALVPLLVLSTWLSLWVQPWASVQRERIRAEQQEESAELKGLRPGQFNEHNQGKLVFYVEAIKNKAEMENVFIQNRQHGKLGLVTASSGFHRLDAETGDHLLVLKEGRRYEGKPGSGRFIVTEFGSYALRIAEGKSRAKVVRTGKPPGELLRSTDVADRAELQERIAFPVSLITLTLIAIPLSRSLPRQGLYGRMFFAFLVYFAFFNLHAVSVSWMKKQVTPEWVGIWWVQLVLVGLALLALGLDSRWLRRLRRRLRQAPAPAAGQG